MALALCAATKCPGTHVLPVGRSCQPSYGGCLCPPHGCLVPAFARASTSTGSPPRATRPRASLPRFPPCISPVAPSASPTSGATGEIHETNCDRDACGQVFLVRVFFHAYFPPLHYPAITEEDEADEKGDSEQR